MPQGVHLIDRIQDQRDFQGPTVDGYGLVLDNASGKFIMASVGGVSQAYVDSQDASNLALAVLLAGRATQTVEGVLEADAFNDITAPEIVSAVIDTSGTTLTITYTEKVQGYSGYSLNDA